MNTTGWVRVPEDLVPQIVPENIRAVGVRNGVAVISVRLLLLLYPSVTPSAIGPSGIEVRWVEDYDHRTMEERVRVAFRLSPRTLEQFGEPQALAQKSSIVNNPG